MAAASYDAQLARPDDAASHLTSGEGGAAEIGALWRQLGNLSAARQAWRTLELAAAAAAMEALPASAPRRGGAQGDGVRSFQLMSVEVRRL